MEEMGWKREMEGKRGGIHLNRIFDHALFSCFLNLG